MSERDLWIRGRLLVVFGARFWDDCRGVPIIRFAEELGVSRQAIYRACPELASTARVAGNDGEGR